MKELRFTRGLRYIIMYHKVELDDPEIEGTLKF